MPPRDLDDAPPPLPGDTKKRGCFSYILWGGVAIAVLTIGFGILLWVLMERGVIMEAELTTGEDLPAKVRDGLRDFAVEPSEDILWFYSAGFLDVREDGNLLTTERVITYHTDEDTDQMSFQSCMLGDVTGVYVKFTEAFVEDTELHVVVRDEAGEVSLDSDELFLVLSNLEGRDHRFVEDLVTEARRQGARIDTIELSGDFSDAELRRIEGAERGGR